MMELQHTIPMSEVRAEQNSERFDFLKGVDLKKIVRIDEVHPSDDNDTEYFFLVWYKPETTCVVDKITKNTTRLNKSEPQWEYEVYCSMGDGLIFVHTWL